MFNLYQNEISLDILRLQKSYGQKQVAQSQQNNLNVYQKFEIEILSQINQSSDFLQESEKLISKYKENFTLFLEQQQIMDFEQYYVYLIYFQLNNKFESSFRRTIEFMNFQEILKQLKISKVCFQTRAYLEIFFYALNQKIIKEKDRQKIIETCYNKACLTLMEKTDDNFIQNYYQNLELYNFYVLLYVNSSLKNLKFYDRLLFLLKFLQGIPNWSHIRLEIKFFLLFKLTHTVYQILQLSNNYNKREDIFQNLDIELLFKFYRITNFEIQKNIQDLNQFLVILILIYQNLLEQVEKYESKKITEMNLEITSNVQKQMQWYYIINLSDQMKVCQKFCHNIRNKKFPSLVITLQDSFLSEASVLKLFDKISVNIDSKTFHILWTQLSFVQQEHAITLQKIEKLICNFKNDEVENRDSVLLLLYFKSYILSQIRGQYKKAMEVSNNRYGIYLDLQKSTFYSYYEPVNFQVDIIRDLLNIQKQKDFIKEKKIDLKFALGIAKKINLEKNQIQNEKVAFYLTKILMLMKQYDEALKIITQFVKWNPQQEEFYVLLYILQEQTNQREQSLQTLSYLKSLNKYNYYIFLLQLFKKSLQLNLVILGANGRHTQRASARIRERRKTYVRIYEQKDKLIRSQLQQKNKKSIEQNANNFSLKIQSKKIECNKIK